MLLQIDHLSKSFGTKKVLDDLNLTLSKNQIIGLLGPNGSGKSTLIRCINDLLVLDQGTILLEGTPLKSLNKEDISYLPERSALPLHWKVKEALDFYASFYSNFDAQKARKLIQEFELDENAEIKAMSKGMQEKLHLALVMSRKAKLYILDEPLGGVDPAARDRILSAILTNFDDDASMIISTHLIAEIEPILDRAIFLKKGKVLVNEEVDLLRAQQQKSLDAYFREVYA